MGRNSDWSPLERAYDPTPGDPTVVSTAAAHYGRVAESIKDAKVGLEAVFAEGVLNSQAIEALSGEALKVAERIGRAYDRYHGVAEALSGYVEPLTTAQSEADGLLATAIALLSDREDAAVSIRYWENERDDARAAGDTAAESFAESRITHYEEVRDGGDSALYTARYTTLPNIEDARDRAANAAAQAIELVENSGDLNDGFWENVDQFFEENPWVQTVMDIASVVGAVLAVVAMFVPGLNILVAAITIAVIAVTVLQMCSGNKSLGEGLLEIGLSIIPFGGGFAKGLGAVGRNTAEAATTAVMRSAAGSGVSGVTRSVAADRIASFLSRTGSRSAASDELAQLIDINALAKMPLRSGAPGASVISAAAPAPYLFAGYVVTDAFGGDIVEWGMDMTGFEMPEITTLDLQDHNW